MRMYFGVNVYYTLQNRIVQHKRAGLEPAPTTYFGVIAFAGGDCVSRGRAGTVHHGHSRGSRPLRDTLGLSRLPAAYVYRGGGRPWAAAPTGRFGVIAFAGGGCISRGMGRRGRRPVRGVGRTTTPGGKGPRPPAADVLRGRANLGRRTT